MSRSVFSLFFVLLLGFAVSAYAEDLYVVDVRTDSITTIDTADHPDPASKRHLAGTKTLLTSADVFGLCVYNNELFATNDHGHHALLVFDVTATGNVDPKRKITSLTYPHGVAVSGDEVFVGDTIGGKGQIKVFNIDDSGDVGPKRTISCDFGDVSLGEVWTLAISGSELFVSDGTKICIFDKTASLNVRPKRVIEHKTTAFTGAYGLAVEGDVVYVSDSRNRIMTFPISTNGAIDPTATISGGSTGLNSPYGLAVKNGYIYASQYGSGKINAYKTTDNLDVEPQWTYTSGDFSSPFSLAMESGGYVRPSDH
ncbi:hypothetical protein [Maridesulfovibrio sp.]|uniref:hypothetical protein n=1 Tax=Maridesulfovibrio sp. TaxID=2795000 RepID=UPI003BAD8A52